MFEAYVFPLALMCIAWIVGSMLNSVFDRLEIGERPPLSNIVLPEEPVSAVQKH